MEDSNARPGYTEEGQSFIDPMMRMAVPDEAQDPFSYEARHQEGVISSAQFGVPTEIFERRDAIRARLQETIAQIREDRERGGDKDE